LLTALVTLAGCGSSATWYSFGSTTASPATSPGLVANLRGLDSAVSGRVRVIERGEGIAVLVSAINLPLGEYRVSFNENANCSSPNGFSAGPPWAPAGMNPRELIPIFTNGDGNAEASATVRGVRLNGENGVAGRSVVVYRGRSVTEARPDVPNNRVACGVFQPAQTLAF
jgi:Cu/Zn superoxide dismutase